ncbi:MAG: hypothetical protein AAF211_12590 [Myxococcota bacterium]
MAVVKGDQQPTLNFDGQRCFHDLAADPKQLTNRYDPADPDVLALWGDLDDLLDDVQATFPAWGTPDRTP